MNTQLRNSKQREIANELAETFQIDSDDVLFLNREKPLEPWIPPDALITVARQHGGFKLVSSIHDKYIPERNQVIFTGTVVNAQEQSFVRSGVATVGERPNGVEMDADVLAAGRAVSAALRDAGFDPTRSGSVVQLNSYQPKENKKPDAELTEIERAARARHRDLGRIHELAREKGLIVVKVVDGKEIKEDTLYRRWLFTNFPGWFNSANQASTAYLTESERAQVMNKLSNHLGDDTGDNELDMVA